MMRCGIGIVGTDCKPAHAKDACLRKRWIFACANGGCSLARTRDVCWRRCRGTDYKPEPVKASEPIANGWFVGSLQGPRSDACVRARSLPVPSLVAVWCGEGLPEQIQKFPSEHCPKGNFYTLALNATISVCVRSCLRNQI